MSRLEPSTIPPEVAAVPSPDPSPDQITPPPDLHLVVVTTSPLASDPSSVNHNTLRTRFWHPGDQRYSDNEFQSLEHALHLFVAESGWTLRQDQGLDSPVSREWIFEARRIDFDRARPEEILQDVGLTPEQVARALGEVKDQEPGAPPPRRGG
jgi:hypothetical protein